MLFPILIREYHPSYTQFIAQIYYNTIHRINSLDYTKEQVDSWAPPECLEIDGWLKRFALNPPILAFCQDTLVGFAEFEKDGHIDCFYVHHEWIRKGVGTAMMSEILKRAKKQRISRIYVEVSITAKPFFEKNEFILLEDYYVIKNGIERKGFKMERKL